MDLASARDRARTVLGPELVDQCQIRRPTPSPFDPFVDPESFTLAPDDDDYTTVYTGVCLLRERLIRRRSDEEGEGLVTRKTWDVLLPHTAPVIAERDIVTLTSSDNPQAVGVPLLVVGVERATYEVFRVLEVDDDTGALART